MTKINSILFLPATNDPEGLLTDGVCGARSPQACRVTPDEPWSAWCGDKRTCTRALVLAWNSQVVTTGCLAAVSNKLDLTWLDVVDSVERTLRHGLLLNDWWPPELTRHGTILFVDQDGFQINLFTSLINK